MAKRRAREPAPGAARVVVVGAGFGGLSAVRELSRAGLAVTLVDRNIYSTFQPLLYQVATGGLNPGDVAFAVRPYVRKHGARFRLGTLAGIDDAARRVTLRDGGVLSYDYLVLASGVSAAYYGVPGAAEYTLGLYTRRDAITLRDQIMARLERLGIDGQLKDVNFTIVGGGATGVELAGALAELRAALDAAFPEVDDAQVHIRLVEMTEHVLAPYHDSLREYARRQLDDREVDIRLSTTISEVRPGRVLLADGEELPSDVTIWAAGVAAPPEAAGWGLPQGAGGRILVRPDLRVVGHDRVLAAGDIALIDGDPLPQLAAVAIQSGRHAGRTIRQTLAGQPTEPFRYRDKGIMATIGRRSAVVELAHGPRMRGTPAWLAWLGLHLLMLLGNRNRLSALLNLSWRYLSWNHGAAVIVADDPPEHVAGLVNAPGDAPDGLVTTPPGGTPAGDAPPGAGPGAPG